MEFDCLPIPNNLLKGCQLLNHRNDIIEHLKCNQIIAEIGVLGGDFSELLLKKSKFLYLIDLYNANDWEWAKRFNSSSHYDYVRNKFLKNQNVRLIKGNSYEVLDRFQNDYFDVIYVDGDHSYDVVKKDLQVAYKKLKKGGLLWINDYTMYDHHTKSIYGVQKATNEIINEHKMRVAYFAFNNSNFHDICLIKP